MKGNLVGINSAIATPTGTYAGYGFAVPANLVKKVIVLNKFFQTEGRINTLIDLMPQLEINVDALTHESQKMYDEVMAAEAAK